MVVANNRLGLDASSHKEVYQHTLHLGLARLEVVTSNQHILLNSIVHEPGDKGVLGGAVDEGDPLLDAGHSVQAGRGYLSLIALDGGQQVVSCVIQAIHDIAVALGVGCPKHNHLQVAEDISSMLLLLFCICASQDQILARCVQAQSVGSRSA